MKDKKKRKEVYISTVADKVLLMLLSFGLVVFLLIAPYVMLEIDTDFLGIYLTELRPLWKLVLHYSMPALAGMIALVIVQGIYFYAKNIILSKR